MLKVFLGFVVSVVVLLASACVPGLIPKAHAASATVIMTHIQAGGVGAATQEFVVLYNNTAEDIDITGWCLTNKSNVTLACFNVPLAGQAIYIPKYGYATAVSSAFAATMPNGIFTVVYTPTNQSSGGITGSADTISLIDHTGTLADRQGWSVSLSSGMHYERIGVGTPMAYIDTDSVADWSTAFTELGKFPSDDTWVDTVAYDLCQNIDGTQSVLPPGMEIIGDDCMPAVIIKIDITEILPNAAGNDDGAEFIELYNPNDFTVRLSDYRFFIGPEFNDVYDFPNDSEIEAHGYKSFSNADIPFNLLNSSSRVRLALQNGIVVSEVPAYENPKDNRSWAYIDGMWQYTNVPTPGLPNNVPDESTGEEVVAPIQQPCAANQYRSMETNRCRLISSPVGTVTPCKDNQYRSEETNRCRNIVADTKASTPCDADEERNAETNRCRKIVAALQPAPCKEGQERSSETNRCRTITKMPNADYGVLGAETKNSGNWYMWFAVGGVLLLAVGYAVWEWHEEIGKFFKNRYLRVIRFARIRK